MGSRVSWARCRAKGKWHGPSAQSMQGQLWPVHDTSQRMWSSRDASRSGSGIKVLCSLKKVIFLLWAFPFIYHKAVSSVVPKALFSSAFLYKQESLSLFHTCTQTFVKFTTLCVQHTLCKFHCAYPQGANAPELVCVLASKQLPLTLGAWTHRCQPICSLLRQRCWKTSCLPGLQLLMGKAHFNS